MKKKHIHDKTFNSYLNLIWDCDEKEFCDYCNKKHEFKTTPSGAMGKTVQIFKTTGIN